MPFHNDFPCIHRLTFTSYLLDCKKSSKLMFCGALLTGMSLYTDSRSRNFCATSSLAGVLLFSKQEIMLSLVIFPQAFRTMYCVVLIVDSRRKLLFSREPYNYMCRSKQFTFRPMLVWQTCLKPELLLLLFFFYQKLG